MIIDIKSATRLFREETNFIRGGLQLTISAQKAIDKAFKKYAEQFINSALEIVTVEKENLPAKINALKDYLI